MRLQHLNYNHLYYFWLIAKEGSITQAAKKLHLTQPTISAQLKQLETDLNCVLFERRQKKLTLTPKGQTVFFHCDVLFKSGLTLQKSLEQRETTQVSRCRVGYDSQIAKKIIHSTLKSFINDPLCYLELDSLDPASLIRGLTHKNYDFILLTHVHSISPQQRYKKISEHPYVFVASSDYKNLKNNFPKSVKGKSLCLPKSPSALNGITDFLKKHDIIPQITLTTDDTEMLRVFAVAGNGISVLPRASVSDLIKSKTLFVLGDCPSINENLFAIYQEEDFTDSIIKNFILEPEPKNQ